MKKTIILLLAMSAISCVSKTIPTTPTPTPTIKGVTLDKGYYSNVYSAQHKGALKVSYTLEKNKVNAVNINKRPSFYTDKSLPKSIQTHHSDYTHTGYDRGHLANDASFDWSEESLKSTYAMSNIVPQLPKVNRQAWLSVEEIERYTATQFKTLDVTNIVEYKNNKVLKKKNLSKVLSTMKFSSAKKKANYIKKYKKAAAYLSNKKIRIPSGFYKVLSNKKHNFKECYYVKNKSSSTSKDVKKYLVNCGSVPNF